MPRVEINVAVLDYSNCKYGCLSPRRCVPVVKNQPPIKPLSYIATYKEILRCRKTIDFQWSLCLHKTHMGDLSFLMTRQAPLL